MFLDCQQTRQMRDRYCFDSGRAADPYSCAAMLVPSLARYASTNMLLVESAVSNCHVCLTQTHAQDAACRL